MAWSATLTDLLGTPVGELAAEHIRQLVTDKVRETDELEFKATLYAKDDEHKVELCKDIAGLRNHRGGIILLGVGEKDAVANGCPEVPFSDPEERRMRQVVASGTAPHAAFEIRRVPGKSETRGFYVLIAEPSPFRPHAVLVADGLRYPRRDGTTTRYLSEAEVADLYRDRFRGEKQQTERLAQIAEEAIPHLDLTESQWWLVVSLVPNSPGDLQISFTARADIEQWARSEHNNGDLIDGFWGEVPPEAGVSVERYMLSSHADRGAPSRYPIAFCFTDGSTSAASTVRSVNDDTPQHKPVVLAPHLVLRAATALRLAGRHALRTGARGDAVVEVRLFGTPHSALGFTHSDIVEAHPSSLLVTDARAHLTLPLEALGGAPVDLLEATRLALGDIFNAFGCPEVLQIAPGGALCVAYFPSGYNVAGLAAAREIPTSHEPIPE